MESENNGNGETVLCYDCAGIKPPNPPEGNESNPQVAARCGPHTQNAVRRAMGLKELTLLT